MSIIVPAASNDLLYLITSFTETKQAWGTLHKHFKAKPITQNQNAIEETDSAFLISKREKENNWLIDSGATSHMTQQRYIFKVYNTFEVLQKVTPAKALNSIYCHMLFNTKPL